MDVYYFKLITREDIAFHLSKRYNSGNNKLNNINQLILSDSDRNICTWCIYIYIYIQYHNINPCISVLIAFFNFSKDKSMI